MIAYKTLAEEIFKNALYFLKNNSKVKSDTVVTIIY